MTYQFTEGGIVWDGKRTYRVEAVTERGELTVSVRYVLDRNGNEDSADNIYGIIYRKVSPNYMATFYGEVVG